MEEITQSILVWIRIKGRIKEFQFKETVVLWIRYESAVLLNSFVSIYNYLHTLIFILIKINKQTVKTL